MPGPGPQEGRGRLGFSGPYDLCMCVLAESLGHVQLLVTLWIVACKAPLSMGFSKNTGGVAISSYRGSSPLSVQTPVSFLFCVGWQILHH